MASLLEQARSLHEDIERAERQIVDLLQEQPKTHSEAVVHDQKIADLVALAVSNAKTLAATYEDRDGSALLAQWQVYIP